MRGRVVEFPEMLRGKWVAYRLNEKLQVIDYDNDLEKLLERLREKGIDVRFIQVDYIPDEDVVFLI